MSRPTMAWLGAVALVVTACGAVSDAAPASISPASAAPSTTVVPATPTTAAPTTAVPPTTVVPTTVAPPPTVPAVECAVTVPDGSFTPPAGYPPEPPADYGTAWYGTPALWTMLHHEGERWADLPLHEGLLGNKLAYWVEGYDVAEDPTPELTVRARRLDGPGEAIHPPPATNAMHPDVGWFIMTGIEFPAAGCWEITASYQGAELTYVAEVG